MEIFKLVKDGCATHYFKELPDGVEIGTNPDNLVKVSHKFAKMKWECLLGKGYRKE